MGEHSLLFNIMIYLSAAVIAVPLFKKIGLGSVLGYLVAGTVIGPWGLALITNVNDILHFAEFGVVLLLFLIGLELEPKRLWSMRQSIFGMGGLQVLLSTILLTLMALAFDLSWTHALIVAMSLSLSSTAIALQILNEKNLMRTRVGNSVFSILLFQDLAVIPMMAIIPLLVVSSVGAGESSLIFDFAKAIGVIVLVVIGGHYLTEPVFRIIARTRMREIFTAFALLLIIGISLLMDMAGMSMALGSFLAGMLLAESEFKHELEVEIEPFKGLLLGLFFIAIGMGINFGLLIKEPLLIILLVFILLSIKIGVLLIITRLFPLPRKQRLLFAFLLSQGGEFAFVLFALADKLAIIPTPLLELLVVVVAISMATTPLLLIINTYLISPRFKKIKPEHDVDHLMDEEHPVIIAGFGRFGRVVGRLLHANSIPTTILDQAPDKIEDARTYGYQVYYGDVRKPALLESAGAENAEIMIICLDDPEVTLEVVSMLKKHFPHLKIYSRAFDMGHAFELMDKGVEDFQREMLGSAMSLGEKALKELGFGAYEAHHARKVFAQHDAKLMHQLYQQDSKDKRISVSIESREELAKLLSGDADELRRRSKDGWE